MSADYDTSTNYYTDGPDTGVVREYHFEITNTTLAPDGIDRIVLAVNGTFPGPTIIADWYEHYAYIGSQAKADIH